MCVWTASASKVCACSARLVQGPAVRPPGVPLKHNTKWTFTSHRLQLVVVVATEQTKNKSLGLQGCFRQQHTLSTYTVHVRYLHGAVKPDPYQHRMAIVPGASMFLWISASTQKLQCISYLRFHCVYFALFSGMCSYFAMNYGMHYFKIIPNSKPNRGSKDKRQLSLEQKYFAVLKICYAWY